jgi:hypothetical protein
MAEHAGLIPIGQAARLLMISEERIRQLVKQGFHPQAGEARLRAACGCCAGISALPQGR